MLNKESRKKHVTRRQEFKLNSHLCRHKKAGEGILNTARSFADNLHKRIERIVHNNAGHRLFNARIEKTIKFLLFEEDNPKHQIVTTLRPIHAILAFYLCLIAPTTLFLLLIPFGPVWLFMGETGFVLATLMALHVIFDS